MDSFRLAVDQLLKKLTGSDARTLTFAGTIFYGGLLWSERAERFGSDVRIYHEWFALGLIVVAAIVALMKWIFPGLLGASTNQ